MFTEITTRLASYLRTSFALSERASAEAAQRLLARILFPRFARALFGLEDMVASFDERDLSPHVDVRAIRAAVGELIESISGHPPRK